MEKNEKILDIIGAEISHEDNNYKSSYIINKLHIVWILCLLFYKITNIIDDQFDIIDAATINNSQDC